MNHETIDFLEKLATLFEKKNLTDLEYEAPDVRIHLSRKTYVSPAYAPENPSLPLAGPHESTPRPCDDIKSHPGAALSPIVGVAYLSPDPESKPFVSLGDSVTQGQTLLIVEAMKTFNPVRAPKNGKIVQILIANEQAVEYGEPLMVIE